MSVEDYSNCKNIYKLIEIIKERTAMFIPDKSITSLFTFLAGYEECIRIHGIIEDGVPDFKLFSKYLKNRFDWNLAYGWAHAIKKNTERSKDPLQRFFDLVKEFQSS